MLPVGAEKEFSLHDGTVRDLCFLPDNRLLSAGAGDCSICLTDVSSGMFPRSISVCYTDTLSGVCQNYLCPTDVSSNLFSRVYLYLSHLHVIKFVS